MSTIRPEMPTDRHGAGPRSAGTAGLARQYLTFHCVGERYGVDVLRVQEIKGWEKVTRVPDAPVFILGVMNLRGMIVPVLDLRVRFGMAEPCFDASTVVVVVHVKHDQMHKTVGLVVDGVSDVHHVETEAVKPIPDVGLQASSVWVQSLATIQEQLVMLLDIDSLVDDSIYGGTTGVEHPSRHAAAGNLSS